MDGFGAEQTIERAGRCSLDRDAAGSDNILEPPLGILGGKQAVRPPQRVAQRGIDCMAPEEAHETIVRRGQRDTRCSPLSGGFMRPRASAEAVAPALSLVLAAACFLAGTRGWPACHGVSRSEWRERPAGARSHKGFSSLFQLTSRGRVTIRTDVALPLGERRAILFPRRPDGLPEWDNRQRHGVRIGRGGMPEWLKGTDCKSVGFAYAGSNPAPSTSPTSLGVCPCLLLSTELYILLIVLSICIWQRPPKQLSIDL